MGLQNEKCIFHVYLFPLQYFSVWSREPTYGKMLVSEFCTALLQSGKSGLSVNNSENKQRQPRPIRFSYSAPLM